MKRLRNYPMVLQDCWALHEALRRMGFESKDIFVHIAQNGRALGQGLWLFVVLKTQDKEFTIDVDSIGVHDSEEIVKLWHDLCNAWNTGLFADSEARRVYNARFMNRLPGPVGLATGILDKGFFFPGRKDKAN